MKLGDEVRKGEFGQINIFVGSFETLLDVDRPLAGNVVGNFDIPHLATFQVLGDNIVSVGEAILRLVAFSVY